MSTVHFLNVGTGDCTLIQHNSKRNTLIDICKGNHYLSPIEEVLAEILQEKRLPGDFGMSKRPTNPIQYLNDLGIETLFRFILTHPDMDHLDGLDALFEKLSVLNFWDTGVKKEKPDFGEFGAYKEKDWDCYESIRDKRNGNVTLLRHLAGSRFKFANRNEDGSGGADGLYILAPDEGLVSAANVNGDINDASFVLLYRSGGGRIVIPGDAHDETWEYILENYEQDVKNCSVLFAPHHGRKSGRCFDFLDILNPKITFFGCAESGTLAYNAWSSRYLRVVTNNQAGNIVMECSNGKIDVYIQNNAFATALGRNPKITNSQGYMYLDSIVETAEVSTS